MNMFHAVSKCAVALLVGFLLGNTQVQAISLVWDNDASTGNWNTTDANWNAGANTFNTGEVDDVTFDGTAPGTINIAAGMDPISTTVSGANNYTFTGGPISGSGALNKSGSGVLTLAGMNTFTGPINFSGGEILFTNSNQLGSSTGLINVTGNSTLSFSHPSTGGTNVAKPMNIAAGINMTLRRAGSQPSPTYSGKISGDGNLVFDKPTGPGGNGWTISNSTNDFTGTVTVSGGAAAATFSNEGALGSATTFNVVGGGLLFGATVDGTGRTVNVSGSVTLGSGGGQFNGLVTGTGAVRANNLWLNNAGNNHASTNMSGIANGTLRVGVAGSLGTGTVSFDSNPGNKIFFMDSVGGTFNNTINMSSGTRTFRVDNPNAVIQYDGTINATGPMTIEGPGTFAVSNWNSTNTLAVTDGTFLMNDAVTPNLSNITVDAGAAFGGNGTLTMTGGQSVTVNGTLEPGNDAAGTLTINGPLNLAATTVLDYELGPSGIVGGGLNDLVQVNGDLVLDGTLQVTNLGGFGAPGTVYRLFNYSGTLTNNGLDVSSLNSGFLDFSTFGQVNLVIPIPEPSTFWLMGCALLIGGRRLRRKAA